MSFAAKTMVNPVSMAANVVPSLFAISKAPHSSPCVSIPFKPFNFHLSCAHFSSLSLPNFLSRTKRKPLLRVVSVVDENNPVVLEEQEQGVEENLNWDAAESDGEVKESDGEGQESGGFVEPPEGSKLYVGNLPYDVDSEKLAMMFEEAGVVELAEVLYRRGSDESRGFGFVTMSTVEEAEKAIEMFHLYNLGGRQLTVNIAAARGTRPERPPRAVDSDPKIYVGNLPWSCDEARLEQLFSEYGKVVSAQLILDRETGRSRGFGFVAMSNESEMNDAIANLDGQSLDGRQLRVNVAMGKKASF